jgi:hypothetical protein
MNTLCKFLILVVVYLTLNRPNIFFIPIDIILQDNDIYVLRAN